MSSPYILSQAKEEAMVDVLESDDDPHDEDVYSSLVGLRQGGLDLLKRRKQPENNPSQTIRDQRESSKKQCHLRGVRAKISGVWITFRNH